LNRRSIKRRQDPEIESLTAEEYVVLAVEALEREVNNGGYCQFFFNTSSAPRIVDTLQRIGCPEAARLTKRALRPPATATEMRLQSEQDEALGRCDTEYYRVVISPARSFNSSRASVVGSC
jgi:hypothetical protein